jgi:hypothetical protein
VRDHFPQAPFSYIEFNISKRRNGHGVAVNVRFEMALLPMKKQRETDRTWFATHPLAS